VPEPRHLSRNVLKLPSESRVAKHR
jgi:hypothetical protein